MRPILRFTNLIRTQHLEQKTAFEYKMYYRESYRSWGDRFAKRQCGIHCFQSKRRKCLKQNKPIWNKHKININFSINVIQALSVKITSGMGTTMEVFWSKIKGDFGERESWRERERERERERVEEVFEGKCSIKTREMAGCKLRQSSWKRVEKSF